MAPWSFMRINYIPMTLGIFFTLGLVTCFCVSVLRGDVSPYIPFISETGGKFPEAGLFSLFLYLSASIAFSAMLVRYLIVDELNRSVDRGIDILNRSSIIIGFLALMGMVVVAAYPMTSIMTAHGIGANILFLGGIVYSALQTALSFRMTPYYNGKTICYIRLTITVITSVALVIMTILTSLGQAAWASDSHKHWTGEKTPDDKGFTLLLIGSIAEWTMAISFIGFYFTYVREFSKVCLHLRVQVLVQHFDDEVCATTATERSPIVT